MTETPLGTLTTATSSSGVGTPPLGAQPDPTGPSNLLKVDRQKSLGDEELAPLIQQRVPNVPFEFWIKEKSKIYGKNHTCAFYPNVFDIKFNNK